MIYAKYNDKKFKIYANGRIKCLDICSDEEISFLKHIVQEISDTYCGPQDGFKVSIMADRLPNFGVDVLSFRDYEMENSPSNKVY